jgi:hypothetical protein
VDPVPDPLLLRKSGCAGNRTRTSGLADRTGTHIPKTWVFINTSYVTVCTPDLYNDHSNFFLHVVLYPYESDRKNSGISVLIRLDLVRHTRFSIPFKERAVPKYILALCLHTLDFLNY